MTFVLEVAHVRPGGPAATAGLAVGDVIVSVDGYDLTGVNVMLYGTLTAVLPGRQIVLGLRGGNQVEITAGKPL